MNSARGAGKKRKEKKKAKTPDVRSKTLSKWGSSRFTYEDSFNFIIQLVFTYLTQVFNWVELRLNQIRWVMKGVIDMDKNCHPYIWLLCPFESMLWIPFQNPFRFVNWNEIFRYQIGTRLFRCTISQLPQINK